MGGENNHDNSRKRKKRKLKLSVSQKKRTDQFIHTRETVCTDKHVRGLKRKSSNTIDDESDISSKVQVIDIDLVEETNKGSFEIDEQDIEDYNNAEIKDKSTEKCEDENPKLPEETSEIKSHRVEIHEDGNDRPQGLEAGNVILPGYLQYALTALRDEQVLIPLLINLDAVNAVDDYLILVKVLSNKKLPADNIPFYLCLERAKFAEVTTTTLMRFRPETKAFFRVGYRTWHGKGMILLSGSKNRGQVKSHFTKRGYYDPAEASVNFAVPDVKTLFGKDSGIPKNINPGMISESFDLINKAKQYVMAYDLKKVVRGFKNDLGDEDMWGFEGPPTLTDTMHRIQQEENHVKELLNLCDEMRLGDLAQKCKLLLRTISNRMQEIRNCEVGHKRLLKKLTHPINKPNYNPEYIISFCKTQIYTCTNWLRGAINCNRHITECLAAMNDAHMFYQNVGLVDMMTQVNLDLLFPPEMLSEFVDLIRTPEVLKQRTNLWLTVRKTARVTGSTCYRAIGLGLLREAREHFDEYILKKPSRAIGPELQQMFDYGTANEINGLAAVATVLMPSLLPPCMQLVEDGCSFIHGDVIQNMMEVSCDGIIECQRDYHDRSCFSVVSNEHHKRILEIKCVFPKENESPIRYHIPIYHACQLLCEMYAKKVSEAWYVVYSPKSTVLITLQFNGNIWNQLWKIIREIFDVEKPVRPDRLNHEHLQMRGILKTYVETHSTFVGEIGSMRGFNMSEFDNIPVMGPYRGVHTCRNDHLDLETIQDWCIDVGRMCTPILKDAYQIQRKRASEILAFVLSDSDREFNKNMPANNPIAYAMKGNSLDINMMRQMVEIVRNRCKEEKINILAEVFDGQFANIACRTMDGKPLTVMRWQKDNWNKFISMPKDKLIRYVDDVSYVPPADIKSLQAEPFDVTARSIEFGNLQFDQTYKAVGRRIYRKYYLSGRGGPEYDYDGSKIRFVQTMKRWKHKAVDPVWDYFVPKKKPSEINTKQVTEEQIMELIACEEFPDPIDVAHSMMDESTIHSESNAETLDESHNTQSLLSEILLKLRQLKKPERWQGVNLLDFYVSKLASAESIAKSFYKDEMDVIAQVLAKKTKTELIFKKNTDKATKVNLLSKYFGDKSKWTTCRKKKKTNVMYTLKFLAMEEIKMPTYPKSLLAVPAAKIRHEMEFHLWKLSHGTPLYAQIPNVAHFEYFCYPEKSACRNDDIECRTFDATHILTNFRSHICRNGFQHVRAQAFKEVCERNNDILSRPVVFDCIDKQNCEIAMQVFSEEVEEDVLKHGDRKTAEFIGLIRNWFLACDERGIKMEDRLSSLVNMHNYMMKLYDPEEYPPPMTHVYSIPVQTFEAMMQSISTRIRLYSYARKHAFNHRSVSSLGVESFFSDLTVVEITGSGCPKAYQIPKLISIITEYNTAKHNPAKIFNMDPRRGVKYPARLLDRTSGSSASDDDSDQNAQFRSHSFDRIPRFIKKRSKFRVSVSGPTQSSRGEQPIRVVGKYKLNEAKLKSCSRMGIPEDITFT